MRCNGCTSATPTGMSEKAPCHPECRTSNPKRMQIQDKRTYLRTKACNPCRTKHHLQDGNHNHRHLDRLLQLDHHHLRDHHHQDRLPGTHHYRQGPILQPLQIQAEGLPMLRQRSRREPKLLLTETSLRLHHQVRLLTCSKRMHSHLLPPLQETGS